MKLFYILGIASVMALAEAAPTADEKVTVVTADYFLRRHVLYSAQHDIVSLTVPLNGLNYETEFKSTLDYSKLYVFFVEADVNEDGKKDYKGLYLFKDNKATMLLETGTDSAADSTYSKNVYISATDGLYVYNSESGKAERYGSVTDNLINVVKVNSSDVLYVLTAENFVYKVTDNGEKKVKVDDIKDARQIVLDNFDNLYYLGADKQPYMLTEGGVKKFDCIPANPTSSRFYKPTLRMGKSVPFVADDKTYIIGADNTCQAQKYIIQAKPSATSLDGAGIDYFAFDKKIFTLHN